MNLNWNGRRYRPAGNVVKVYKPSVNELMKPLSEKNGLGSVIWTGTFLSGVPDDVPSVSPSPTSTQTPTPTKTSTPTPTNTPSQTGTSGVTPTPTQTPTQTITPTCGTFTQQYLSATLQSCHNFKLSLWDDTLGTNAANAVCDVVVSGCAYGDQGTIFCGTETITAGQHNHNFSLQPVLQPGECVSAFTVNTITEQCPCYDVSLIFVTPTPTPSVTQTQTPTITQTQTQTPSETPTNTPTPSITASQTATPTQTTTRTPTQTRTPSQTPDQCFDWLITTEGSSVNFSVVGVTSVLPPSETDCCGTQSGTYSTSVNSRQFCAKNVTRTGGGPGTVTKLGPCPHC